MTEEHQHKFVFLRTTKRSESGSYQLKWFRTDYFFCEGCLETRELPQEGYGRDAPDWFRAE